MGHFLLLVCQNVAGNLGAGISLDRFHHVEDGECSLRAGERPGCAERGVGVVLSVKDDGCEDVVVHALVSGVAVVRSS